MEPAKTEFLEETPLLEPLFKFHDKFSQGSECQVAPNLWGQLPQLFAGILHFRKPSKTGKQPSGLERAMLCKESESTPEPFAETYNQRLRAPHQPQKLDIQPTPKKKTELASLLDLFLAASALESESSPRIDPHPSAREHRHGIAAPRLEAAHPPARGAAAPQPQSCGSRRLGTVDSEGATGGVAVLTPRKALKAPTYPRFWAREKIAELGLTHGRYLPFCQVYTITPDHTLAWTEVGIGCGG